MFYFKNHLFLHLFYQFNICIKCFIFKMMQFYIMISYILASIYLDFILK